MTPTQTAQNRPAPVEISGAPGRPRRALTEREMLVLSRVADNWTNRMIADELEVNPVTVTNILHRIYEQLNVTNRLTAVLKAIQLGLLVLPELPELPEQSNGTFS
jgi:DNA-binding NarL/FixJ family response regulator